MKWQESDRFTAILQHHHLDVAPAAVDRFGKRKRKKRRPKGWRGSPQAFPEQPLGGANLTERFDRDRRGGAGTRERRSVPDPTAGWALDGTAVWTAGWAGKLRFGNGSGRHEWPRRMPTNRSSPARGWNDGWGERNAFHYLTCRKLNRECCVARRTPIDQIVVGSGNGPRRFLTTRIDLNGNSSLSLPIDSDRTS